MAEEASYLLISQNNRRRTVKIKEVSEALASTLGYLRSEMEGRELLEYLGDKTADALRDYLEYDEESADVDDVLARVREFRLKMHSGAEAQYTLKCFRETPRDDNHWFRLLLKDERRQIEEQSLPTLLKQNLAGVIALDEATGLADRITCERYLDQIANYVGTHEVKACFAVLTLDRYDKSLNLYGADNCMRLIRHVAQHCKGKFREEDLVSYLGDGQLGLLLMDTTEESARIVLNRLRWFIASHRLAFAGKTDFSVTVSIAFAEMLGESGQDIMRRVERATLSMDPEERSSLLKAGL